MIKFKIKALFYLAIPIIFILGMINFSCHTIEEGEKAGWDYDTIVINKSCSMYIEYAKGSYLLNISTMDSCTLLSDSMYLEGYKQLLDKYSHKLLSHKGIITFQTSFALLNNNWFIDKLIEITNEQFHSSCVLVKKEKFIFIIDVKPK